MIGLHLLKNIGIQYHCIFSYVMIILVCFISIWKHFKKGYLSSYLFRVLNKCSSFLLNYLKYYLIIFAELLGFFVFIYGYSFDYSIPMICFFGVLSTIMLQYLIVTEIASKTLNMLKNSLVISVDIDETNLENMEKKHTKLFYNYIGLMMIMAFILTSSILYSMRFIVILEKLCTKSFLFAILFLHGIKTFGCMLTKAGDIISDYRNKILNNGKEDSDDSDISYVDNLGDIIGDALCIFVDALSISILGLITIHKYFFYNYQYCLYMTFFGFIVFCCIELLRICILCFRVKSSTISDCVFIFSSVVTCIFGSLFYWNSKTTVLSSIISGTMSDIVCNCLPYILVLVIMFMLNISGLINYLSLKTISSLPIIGSLGSLSVAWISSLFIFLVALMCKSAPVLYKKMGYANESLNGTFAIVLIVLTVVYYYYKTIIATTNDAACGIYKKLYLSYMYIINDADDKNNNVCNDDTLISKYNNIIEDNFDSMDYAANIDKLISKIAMIILMSIHWHYNSISVFSNFISLSIVGVFCMMIYHILNKISIKDLTFKNIMYISSLVNIGWILFYTFILYYGVGTYSFFGFLSILSYILGTIFDIQKKHKENNKKIENINYYIMQDMFGDIFKDVLGPFFFSCSIVANLIT